MIKIEKVNVSGWEAAIRGMRNPMNSWDKSDSYDENGNIIELGEKDLALMKKLVKAGTDHSKFMRMINVTLDITAPLYWWKEFDTYKVGTVRNSCSTMHTVMNQELTTDDFSFDFYGIDVDTVTWFITCLNELRKKYLETNDKRYWYVFIQLLPEGFNQKATVQLNYQVLRSIYHSRKNHKLYEWREFCDWIESLPYNVLITGESSFTTRRRRRNR